MRRHERRRSPSFDGGWLPRLGVQPGACRVRPRARDERMNRRRLLLRMVAGVPLLGVGGLAAQSTPIVRRIGFLWDSPRVWPQALDGFRQGMRDLGWVDGQNIIVDYRWADGHFERLPSLVDELLRLKVEVIVAPTSIYTGA